MRPPQLTPIAEAGSLCWFQLSYPKKKKKGNEEKDQGNKFYKGDNLVTTNYPRLGIGGVNILEEIGVKEIKLEYYYISTYTLKHFLNSYMLFYTY